MSSRFLRAGAASLLFAATALPVLAQEGGDWSANVAVTNDYVWRGASQTDNGPALQAGLDYTNGAFYAGGWASNIDFGSEADVEVDLYGGFRGEFTGGLTWDVGVIGYIYPGDNDIDFLELKAGLGFTADALSGGVTAYYDPDNQNTYVEGTAAYGFTDKFKGLASVGNYSFDGAGEYVNWSLGGTYSFEAVDLTLKYTDTDIDFPNDNVDENFVVMLSKVF